MKQRNLTTLFLNNYLISLNNSKIIQNFCNFIQPMNFRVLENSPPDMCTNWYYDVMNEETFGTLPEYHDSGYSPSSSLPSHKYLDFSFPKLFSNVLSFFQPFNLTHWININSPAFWIINSWKYDSHPMLILD